MEHVRGQTGPGERAPGRTEDRSLPGRALREAQDRFIAAWGQMGSTWGVSRTMAEVHALLYITGEPMCTDDVMARLHISRGNASMSLRALVDWAIVSRVHKRGDRKEYFRAEQDAWAVLQNVVRERMKREIHPLLASLFDIRELTAQGAVAPADTPAVPSDADAPPDPVMSHNHRLDAMLELLRTLDSLGERFVESPVDQLKLTTAVLARDSELP